MEEKYFNPFPGLRPFEEDEEHLFFGRETQIDQLSSKLSKNHFLAVIGASGSGKSSLVKSGLIPVLHSGLCSGVGHGWRIGVFRPGDNPIKNLTECFFADELLGDNPKDEQKSLSAIIEATLRRSDFGLKNVHEQLLNHFEENILLVVDQFEELFRFSNAEKQSKSVKREADAFINLLLQACSDSSKKFYIAITMRSDFLGDCTAFRGLPEAINQGQYLIPRMNREEIKLAITGPVAVAGVKISSRLVTKLLNDVGDSPDHLPILQHALMRTFNQWKSSSANDTSIDLIHYESIGTMNSALSQHAEEAFSILKDDQTLICEGLFKALTEKGESLRGIRRPTRLSSICSIIDQPLGKVIPIIEVFRNPSVSFLMPPVEKELDENSIIDISHESLMRVWERLIKWVNQELESSEIYLRLSDASKFHSQGKSALWRDPELQLALNWKKQNKPNKYWSERYNYSYDQSMAFLQKSLDKKQEDEREALSKKKAARKRTRMFFLLISIGLVFSLIFAYQSYLSKQKAEIAEQQSILLKEKAEIAAQKAKLASKLAIENEQKANKQSQLAIKNAKLAIDQKNIAERQRRNAKLSEQKALKQKNIAQREKRVADSAKAIAEQQRIIAIENKNKALLAQKNANKLKNIEQAKRWIVLADKYVNVYPKFSGKLIVAAYDTLIKNTSNLENTDVFSTMINVVTKLRGSDHFSKSFITDDNFRDLELINNQVIMASSNGQLINYNLLNKTKTYSEALPNEFNVRAISSSEKHQLIAFGSVNGELVFRDYNDVNLFKNVSNKKRIKIHNGVVKDLCFIDDSNLVSIGFDSTVKQLNIKTGLISVINEGNISSRLWAMTQSNTQLFVSNAKNELLVFKKNKFKCQFQKIKSINIENGIITAMKYFDAFNVIAIGTSSGEILFYSPTYDNIVFSDKKTHNSLISSIDQRENLLLTSSYDKKVVSWYFSKVNKYDWQKGYLLHKDLIYNAKFVSDYNVLSVGEKEINYWTFSLIDLYNEIKANLKNDISFTTEQINKYELFLTNP